MTLIVTQEELKKLLGEQGNKPKNTAKKVTLNVNGIEYKFDSITEQKAFEDCWVWWAWPIEHLLNKPMSLYLPGRVRYTPDIGIVSEGTLHLIEVKGSWRAYQSGRSSKNNLSIANAHYYWLATFYALIGNGKHWVLHKIIDHNNQEELFRC